MLYAICYTLNYDICHMPYGICYIMLYYDICYMLYAMRASVPMVTETGEPARSTSVTEGEPGIPTCFVITSINMIMIVSTVLSLVTSQ